MAEIRDDLEKIRRSIKPRASGLQSTLFVGRIVNRGAMPTAAGRFVTVNPVTVSGDEVENGAATMTADVGTDVIADWIGPGAPTVGKNVMVESVANRWVAWTSGSASTCVPCLPCCIPKRDLTLSWVNGYGGGGAAIMVWDGAVTWEAKTIPPDPIFRFPIPPASSRLASASLKCVGGQWQPTFTPVGGGSMGVGCEFMVYSTCVPLLVTFATFKPVAFLPNIVLCPALYGLGYLQFTITL